MRGMVNSISESYKSQAICDLLLQMQALFWRTYSEDYSRLTILTRTINSRTRSRGLNLSIEIKPLEKLVHH
ncbi:uncharacterized protein PHALS_14520 [Plasmopara halstedii]|uniref:Uncharacterized protein n=1 Tax=Plasmopara halstedii TaxID=4781 RepID=A0A0P1AJS1_PLAHL|nr:uncharacterized protein PHALS_14520 [Plasmopara halstedii]CEG41312.1 hypothetical protein PHALS_14520 [Plasmopara halstedii]|eukprot:XP_024577681.1 hypothetical protein PHALS_14520 [Plasmopara halstedii]